jgi:RNA polymerase sigma factor (sigma-70 family)
MDFMLDQLDGGHLPAHTGGRKSSPGSDWKRLEATSRKALMRSMKGGRRTERCFMKRQQTTSPKSQAIEDAILIQEALAGNQRAFANLVDRYSSSLFRFIYHYLREYDSACDVLQQVFLQFYLSLSSIHTGLPLKAWLLQVARSRCIDELRRRQRYPLHLSLLESRDYEEELPILSDKVDPDPLPEELIEQRELQHDLQQAIEALPAGFRSVVWLRYQGQLSFPEIGKVLGIPEATAKTYFFRAKPLLRAFFVKLQDASLP